ncbi:MAG: response regulator [Prevotellaceae bacterium]|jgi:signal transduction histidine kinase/ligand-binding sensor domain-containing protein/DNA-binding response OmpR family regulator|nr:response regulator [Prevotellaceae bacterium]
MRFLFAGLFFILCSTPNLALNISDYRFHTMPETSYYGGIHSITKDSIGRIWFSGYDALFIYNGNSFVQMNDFVTKLLPSSYWLYGQVVTDTSKRLYVGTNQGLLRFNYQTKDFELILTGNIASVTSNEDGTMWLVRDGKIETFYPGRLPDITSYPLPPDVPITALICTKEHIYIGSNGKVYRLDKKTGQHSLFSSLGDDRYVVRDVIEYKESVYILTHMDGLYECDNKGNVVKHYNLSREYGKSASTKKLYLDASNIIWIATQSGLFLLDPHTGEMHCLRSNFHYTYSLPNNSVWSIYPDPDGGTWIGTYGGKLAYMTFFDNDVNYFKATPGGLSHPIVSCFEEDRDGNLWIGTEGGGLNYWDRKTDRFSYYTRQNQTGVTSNMIKKLWYDEKGALLISAFNGGMERFDDRQQRFVDLRMLHPATSQQLSVYDFVMEDSSGIWMTDPDARLMYKDKKKGAVEIVSLFDSTGNAIRMQIETLFRDKNNNLWLVTHRGAYVVDVSTRRIIKHYYIENAPYSVNILCSFCITSDADIWFGTRGGGANRLGADGSYVNFEEQEGLFGKTVFGILEDTASKDIWFSTNDGLYYYDYKNRKINKSRIDNLSLCGAFYVRACYKTSKGEMLFGGTDGFIMFTPGKIKYNNQKIKVFFTDLLINNKKIVPEAKGSPLKKDISTLSCSGDSDNKIILSHKQSNIEVRVSANSYLHAEKNQYAYRMIGLSDAWNFLPRGQKTIQFFNLPAGNYIFEVKAANNDGLWGDEVSALHFEVKPSPFFSVWAYIVYTILLLCIVYFIWRYFTNKKIFKNRLEMEQIKEQNMKKLTQARINFFTNISHDLKTPLTLVVNPLKQLKECLPEDKTPNTYVRLIEKNVNRIQRMISQLLQFREIESQKITFNHQPGDLIQYIKDIFSLFELYANKKGIETDVNSDIERFYTKFDHDVIEKIFTNLFSNAIKYTTENGFVGIKINKTTQEELTSLGLPEKLHTAYISVGITNTGAEIPDDKKEEIFDSFNRLASGRPAFEEGTGLGLAIVKELVNSLEGKVSLHSGESKVTFTVVLPFTLNVERTDSKVVSYEYTISEIDNMLAESEEMNVHDKRSRKMYSIVVIEDDLDLRTYMEQRLSEYYNVYTATNGNEGIAKTEKIYPQIVITDLLMPEADGFDVCRNLRSNIKTSHIPIIVLSALGENTENKIKALESGANVFIDKPFDMDFLLKQVDNLIKNQNELKALYSKKYIAEPSEITISSMDEKLLKRAMAQIEQNISNFDYNVETFVSDMGIGRTLLYQKINDIVGMSIKEFIMDVRLKRSAQLLKASDLTISEIADQTGFVNPKYFSICFKKHFELTPSEFKKKV